MAEVTKKPARRKTRAASPKSAKPEAAAEVPAAQEAAPEAVDAVETPAPEAPVPDKPTLNQADIAILGTVIGHALKEALAAVKEPAPPAHAEAVLAAAEETPDHEYTPGGKHIEADIAPRPMPSAETLAGWSDAQIEEWNREEDRRVNARKKRQSLNLKQFQSLSPSERRKYLTRERDQSVIREADNPDNEDMIDVIAKRRIFLSDLEMSDVDEHVRVPRSVAVEHNENGVVKVII